MPATDDEIMEVEDFLVDEQIELPVVTNTGNVECISNESSSGKPQKESSEGLLLLLLSLIIPISTLSLWIVLGIYIHVLFCVPTFLLTLVNYCLRYTKWLI